MGAFAPAPKTSSLQAWGERLQRYASSEALLAELPYWREQLDPNGLTELPRDHAVETPRVGEAVTVEVRLDRPSTAALIQRASAAYRTKINDLLLTALARVLCRWSGGWIDPHRPGGPRSRRSVR